MLVLLGCRLQLHPGCLYQQLHNVQSIQHTLQSKGSLPVKRCCWWFRHSAEHQHC